MQHSHSSQGEQAASAAVPLEYLQCVYSHTTQSALTAASHSSQSEGQRASTAQPLSDPANEKPSASNSSSSYSSSQSEATRAQQHCSSPAAAAGRQSSILEVQFSITDNLTAVKSNTTVILRMELPFCWNYYSNSCHSNRSSLDSRESSNSRRVVHIHENSVKFGRSVTKSQL